jgi:hypothetical protein
MDRKQAREFLGRMGVCANALLWFDAAAEGSSAEEIYYSCPNPLWLLFLYHELDVDMATLCPALYQVDQEWLRIDRKADNQAWWVIQKQQRKVISGHVAADLIDKIRSNAWTESHTLLDTARDALLRGQRDFYVPWPDLLLAIEESEYANHSAE